MSKLSKVSTMGVIGFRTPMETSVSKIDLRVEAAVLKPLGARW